MAIKTSYCDSEDMRGGGRAVPPVVGVLSSHDTRVKQRFWILTMVIAMAIVVVILHELAAWHATPVPATHTVLHFGLLAIAVALMAGIPILWNSCHVLRDYQTSLRRSYDHLEEIVQERTSELAESESLFASLFNALEERMVVVDRDDRIVKANRAAVNQAGRDPCGQLFSEIFPPCRVAEEQRRELALIHYTFQTGVPYRGRLVRGGRDCDRILSVDTYPVADAGSAPRMVIQLIRDVTREKEAEIQSHHKEKMAALGTLASGFAHDLGNPLASLSSELQMLEYETELERYRDSLSVLHGHVNRIVRGLREMVDFARRRSDQTGDVALPNATVDALRLVRHDPRAADISFHTEFASQLPAVRMKEDDVVLVLVNLLLNAFDAMGHRGSVKITAVYAGDGRVLMTVEDSGTGMDEQVLHNAVQPMFTTKTDRGGTGLGLALSADIMQLAGGVLELQSELGRGTTVRLMFPASRQIYRGDEIAGMG